MTKVKVVLESCDFIKHRSHRDIPHVIVVQMSYYYHVDTIICQMCGPKSNNYHPEGNTYTSIHSSALPLLPQTQRMQIIMSLLLTLRFSSIRHRVTLADYGYPVEALWFSCSQRLVNYISTLNVPNEGYSRNASCALNLMSTFLFICN